MTSLLATALRAAEAAARIHLTHFRRFNVESAREKGRSDFVSAVDLEAQEAAISVIREAFPDHRVLAEEEGHGHPGDASWPESGRAWPEDGGYLWIIDPLDGTTNYLHGHPMFAASVAVGSAAPGPDPAAMERMVPAEGKETETRRGDALTNGPNGGIRFRGVLEAAAVVAPRTQERWWARRGGGAWKNGGKVSVSDIRTLDRALVGTGFPFKEPGLAERYSKQLMRVLPASGGVRRGGSAALDLCYLAEGILDAFWEEEYLSPWDVAAGLLILSEAGGVAARLDGRAMDLEDGSVLAANSPDLLGSLGDAVRPPSRRVAR